MKSAEHKSSGTESQLTESGYNVVVPRAINLNRNKTKKLSSSHSALGTDALRSETLSNKNKEISQMQGYGETTETDAVFRN